MSYELIQSEHEVLIASSTLTSLPMRMSSGILYIPCKMVNKDNGKIIPFLVRSDTNPAMFNQLLNKIQTVAYDYYDKNHKIIKDYTVKGLKLEIVTPAFYYVN